MPFRTALSGLNAAQSELRVVGNNVANAATAGFKKARAEFSDLLASSGLGASGNAIGSGVQIAGIKQQFSQGVVTFTDNNLDLAVSGSGFFVVDDNGARSYTRAGNFGVNQDGEIVNSQNQTLVGFQADDAGNILSQTGPLRLNLQDSNPQQTSLINVGVNLDASEPVIAGPIDPDDPTSYNSSTSLTVFDSQGASHLAAIYLRKDASNSWQTRLYIDGNPVAEDAGEDGIINFNQDGTIVAGAANGTVVYDPTFNPNAPDTAPMPITINYNGQTPSTQYGSTFNVNALDQDGFTTGRVSSLDIDESGIVQARFTNGENRIMGQIALANFSNPQGLTSIGENAWVEGFSSGQPVVAAPGTSVLGTIQSGALEGSNVDITEQLVGMITAQRNFQANAEVISVADAMTQTIINIR